MRTVLLAAPSYDGKAEVWHIAALNETTKLCLRNGIDLKVVYMAYDSLVQRARNDIAKLVVEDSSIDDLFMVDCDVDWNPSDFLKLLNYDVDIVGGAYPKKSDRTAFPVKMSDPARYWQRDSLVEVEGLGAGFLRMSRRVIEAAWEASEEYHEPDKGTHSRLVFDVKIQNGELWSEDTVFFKKIRSLGYTVWLDPDLNFGHTGIKRWQGNFDDYMLEHFGGTNGT